MTAGPRNARAARRARGLTAVARSLAGARGPAVDSLVPVLLALSPGDPSSPPATGLNNDGTPLQLCLSADPTHCSLRLIGDPGAHLPTAARYERSRDALRQLLAATGAAGLTRLAEETLSLVVPADPDRRARYRDGFVWLAASPARPGAAFYAEMAPLGRDDGWDAACAWLRGVLPSADLALQTIEVLRRTTVVASAGIEGSGPEDARAKIYFRFAQPAPLDALGLDLLLAEPMDRFLTTAMGDFGVDLDGFVLCVGFHVATGHLADVKIDLCGHCLLYDGAAWCRLVNSLCDRLCLAAIPLESALSSGRCEVAMIGLGLDVEQRARLNVYLKPSVETPDNDDTDSALDDAIGYLCAIQNEDGHWSDYALPVGASDQWVTAYVALALAQCGRLSGRATATAAARRAAHWLLRDRPYSAGWGFNRVTGPDADSTAMAIGALDALGLDVPPADRAFLLRQWRAGGGLATYEGPRAWGHAHWDVTPRGYLGLARDAKRAVHDDFLQALEANRLAGGLWRSYWWRRPYYSTLQTLEALAELGIAEPDAAATDESTVFDNAFDLAASIGIRAFRGLSRDALAADLAVLLRTQQRDGRWPGHPNLRVTEETCEAPWNEPRGVYYRDDAGTITTATAVRVLARLPRERVTSDFEEAGFARASAVEV